MKSLFLVWVACFVGSAFAACPTQILECGLLKPDSNGRMRLVRTIASPYVIAMGECFANAHFSVVDTGTNYSVNAAVDTDYTGLIWIGNEDGIIGPQYSFEATPGKGVSVDYEKLKMVCRLD